jgi:hypothetical protein
MSEGGVDLLPKGELGTRSSLMELYLTTLVPVQNIHRQVREEFYPSLYARHQHKLRTPTAELWGYGYIGGRDASDYSDEHIGQIIRVIRDMRTVTDEDWEAMMRLQIRQRFFSNDIIVYDPRTDGSAYYRNKVLVDKFEGRDRTPNTDEMYPSKNKDLLMNVIFAYELVKQDVLMGEAPRFLDCTAIDEFAGSRGITVDWMGLQQGLSILSAARILDELQQAGQVVEEQIPYIYQIIGTWLHDVSLMALEKSRRGVISTPFSTYVTKELYPSPEVLPILQEVVFQYLVDLGMSTGKFVIPPSDMVRMISSMSEFYLKVLDGSELAAGSRDDIIQQLESYRFAFEVVVNYYAKNPHLTVRNKQLDSKTTDGSTLPNAMEELRKSILEAGGRDLYFKSRHKPYSQDSTVLS